MSTYRTFTRSARNFQELASARKMTVETGLTYEQARVACEKFNGNRTPRQMSKGTKLELTAE